MEVKSAGGMPVSRIFISHSSTDNAPAIALRDWLVGEGWDDLFLDLDPERGIAAGERWERALNEAAHRCEAVLFLISKAWLGSAWCKNELSLARRVNKRLFGILIEEALPQVAGHQFRHRRRPLAIMSYVTENKRSRPYALRRLQYRRALICGHCLPHDHICYGYAESSVTHRKV